jgi:hypothetical protein
MAEPAKTIREWLGLGSALPLRSRQQAARDQLQGHIDEALLEPFLRRTVSPEQHAVVIGHLNVCDPCREAIALVLLAQQDPSAAAELELKRKELARHSEPWQRVAMRWTVVVMASIIILAILFILPQKNDPDSRIGRWINSQAEQLSSAASESDTSYGALIAAKLTREESRPSEDSQSGRWFSDGSADARHSTEWSSAPAPQAAAVKPGPARMEVPLPQKRESAASKSASEDEGRGLWFFGADEKPESTAPPVWDPVREARRTRPDPPEGMARPSSANRRLVVSPEGTLRRTLDGGATWDGLNVGQPVRFSALALSGTTVWAAGAHGALYRSPDAAEHWQPVIVRHRGVAFDNTHVANLPGPPMVGLEMETVERLARHSFDLPMMMS